MAGQYTTTQQLLPSNVMTDAMPSSKVDVNAKTIDKEAFSKELNKASKNYTDKSEIENHKNENNNYSKETKNIHDNKKTLAKEINNEKQVEVKEKQVQNEDSITTKESETAKTTDIATGQEGATEIKNTEETSTENVLEETQITEPKKTVEELIEEIKINATTMAEECLDVVAKTTENENIIQKSNVIATEQMIANVEFESSDAHKIANDISKTIQNNKQAVINENTIKTPQQTIISNNTNVNELSKMVDKNIEQLLSTKEDIVQKNNVTTNLGSNIDNVPEQDIKLNIATQNIDLEEQNNKSETNLIKESLNTKSTKEMVASDVTRLTINLENSIDTNSRNIEEIQNTKAVVPSDNLENVAPKIQITEEVAAQVKESLGTGIENKDNVSKIKDKAVQTMMNLQDKNTVLTETQTYDTNSNNTNLGQNNANETVAKLSIETSNFNTAQPQTAETFINRLETHIASRENTLAQNQTINQNDILSQVNAKFEQLQQQANNKVSIVLQPESLGKVSVEIMNTKDGIIAKMTTDTQQVKELFDKNIESLKSNLSAQGVNVNNIKVECTHESTNNAMNFERDQFNQSFNNQQNGHNTNKSEQNIQNSYDSNFGTNQDETTEEQESVSLKNNETIIKHNGKVDYSV